MVSGSRRRRKGKIIHRQKAKKVLLPSPDSYHNLPPLHHSAALLEELTTASRVRRLHGNQATKAQVSDIQAHNPGQAVAGKILGE